MYSRFQLEWVSTGPLLLLFICSMLVGAYAAGPCCSSGNGVPPSPGVLPSLEKLASLIRNIYLYPRAPRIEDHPVVRPEQPWPYRSLQDAKKWSLVETHARALQATVTHAPLPGVTTAMLEWWFKEGIHGEARYPGDGRIYSKYLIWHPRDHILQETIKEPPSQHSMAGALWRIAEYFGSPATGYTQSTPPPPPQLTKPLEAMYINAVTQVEQLDRSALAMTVSTFWPGSGKDIWHLIHTWTDSPQGAQVTSAQTVGSTGDTWKPLWYSKLRNTVIRSIYGQGRPSVDAAETWLRHCVEEFGNLPHFLPQFFQEAHAAATDADGGARDLSNESPPAEAEQGQGQASVAVPVQPPAEHAEL